MTQKYSFRNDYSEIGHPKLIESISTLQHLQFDGYGEDRLSSEAKDLIKEKLKRNDVDIHFVSGGTQTNLITLASMLKPYESVIAPVSGHICTHETGAIESTGHKINTVPSTDGKLTPSDIESVLSEHVDEHMVKPKVVFISNSTEIGSIYKKDELVALSECCKKNNLYLYIDGARLASALTSSKNDVTLEDLAILTDAFYIGGTKNGALLGEALVLVNDQLKENFRFYLKQNGALLAKGGIIGAQFKEFFKDDLYFELASHGNKQAEKIIACIENSGYSFLTTPESNQVFPILPNKLIEALHEVFEFYVWEAITEDTSAVRIVTSWATPNLAINKFMSVIIANS